MENKAKNKVESKSENKPLKIAQDPINYGIKALIFFSIIFLSWAAFVPIKSAAIADGIVVLDFNKKIIQHLEGGIIEKIFVKEGQDVEAGDVLMSLSNIKAKAEKQIDHHKKTLESLYSKRKFGS